MSPAVKRPRRRAGLFHGWWTDTRGTRIRRIRRAELAELYRLRSKHSDIWNGRMPASASVGLLLGDRMPLA